VAGDATAHIRTALYFGGKHSPTGEVDVMAVQQASANFVANSAMVVVTSVTSPTTVSVVDLATATTVPPSMAPPPGHPVATVAPTFKLVFLSVLAITVVAGLLQIVLAAYWTTPTANQQASFEAMSFAWKTGLGAILGLLGGKVT
jgi:hypothetical protein